MTNFELEEIINQKLNSQKYNDIVPNGLQIEGKNKIKKIVTGVTACQKLLDFAVYNQADAIIVHHGYFWKNEPNIILGMQRKRLKTILSNNINLYSWHLPLDIHPILGNNIHIAKKLNINVKGNISSLVLWGEFTKPMTNTKLCNIIFKKFKRKPFYYHDISLQSNIVRIAWCSGAGQKFIVNLRNSNIDAFLTGEVSENTIHFARENNLHFFSVGHHVTEIDGIKSLGKWLEKKYHLDVDFLNVFNPV